MIHDLAAAIATSVSFPALIELFLKGQLAVVIGLFLTSELEHSPAAVRSRVIAGTFVCLASLPLLNWIGPNWNLAILPRHYADASATSSPPWVFAAFIAYAVTALLLATRLLFQIGMIAKTSLRADPATQQWIDCIPTDMQNAVVLKTSHAVKGPMTWGALRPTIILPPHTSDSPDWTTAQRTMILRHELAHIRRGDWLIVLLARWVAILYWPIPGVKKLLQQLSLYVEQACDDHVIVAGADSTDYAQLLVSQARREQLDASLPLATPSGLGIRVRYLVREIVDRSALSSGRFWVYPLALALALPLAAMNPVEAPAKTILVPLNRPAMTSNTNDELEIPKTPVNIRKPSAPISVLKPPQIIEQEAIFAPRGETLFNPPPKKVEILTP